MIYPSSEPIRIGSFWSILNKRRQLRDWIDRKTVTISRPETWLVWQHQYCTSVRYTKFQADIILYLHVSTYQWCYIQENGGTLPGLTEQHCPIPKELWFLCDNINSHREEVTISLRSWEANPTCVSVRLVRNVYLSCVYCKNDMVIFGIDHDDCFSGISGFEICHLSHSINQLKWWVRRFLVIFLVIPLSSDSWLIIWLRDKHSRAQIDIWDGSNDALTLHFSPIGCRSHARHLSQTRNKMDCKHHALQLLPWLYRP